VQESDLNLYTTDELVAELVRRTTFLGVVVRSETEFKDQVWGPERVFKVHFNPKNLGSAQVGRLLDTVAEGIERDHA
jgi:hypothetical protein